MPYSDPEQQKKAQADWYQRRKTERAKWLRERKARLTRLVQEYKTSKGCARCGFNGHPRALDFHHPNGKSSKAEGIAQLVCRGVAVERLQTAMEACEVICANCHRIEHSL